MLRPGPSLLRSQTRSTFVVSHGVLCFLRDRHRGCLTPGSVRSLSRPTSGSLQAMRGRLSLDSPAVDARIDVFNLGELSEIGMATRFSQLLLQIRTCQPSPVGAISM